MAERTYTLEEVAEILRLHPDTLRRMIKQKKVIAVKVGRSYRIRQSEVDRLLNEGTL